MAFSFETSGFQYNPLAPRLEGSPLAGLKPIQQPQQSPVQINALPAWQIPSIGSTTPIQGLAAGISSAFSSIGQGIQAAYKSKREDEKDLLKLKIATENKNAESQETIRHHLELERNARDRIKSVLPPDYGPAEDPYASEKTDATTSVPTENSPPLIDIPKFDRYERHAPVKATPFEFNLPENDGTQATPSQIQLNPYGLTNLTSPVPAQAAPSPLGQSALDALANTDWSQIKGDYVASTGGGAPTQIPAPQPAWLRKPTAVTGALANLGGFGNAALPNTDQYLADTQQALAQTPPPAAAPVAETKGSVPRAAFKSYEAARQYMEDQAGNPNWYAESTPKPDKFGNFIIPWKQNDPAAKALREESQKTRDQTQKSMEQKRMETQILNEARSFNLQKPVSNFLRQGGTKELMLPFIAAYENSNKHPEAAGQAEVDMIDLLGRAMSGGKITVGQTQLIENAMSLKDKYLTKFKGQAYGGGFLPEPIKRQMVRTFTETYNYGADAANKVVTATKNRLETSGIPKEKAGVYYFVGGHQPDTEVMLKTDALEKIKAGRDEIAKLITEKQKASAEEVDIIDKKISAIKEKSKTLHDRLLDEADVESLVLGAKKLQDINLPEGFGGGDAAQVEVVPN